MGKPRICAVVVTFNRRELLLKCLEALRRQTYPLDAIFIVDGPSTDGTPEALLEYGYIKELPPKKGSLSWETTNSIYGRDKANIEVHYVRLYSDVGGSGEFHEGIKKAYVRGCDWIWLMDDDAEPKEDALEKLTCYLNLPNAIALSCLKIDENGNVIYPHIGYLQFEHVIKHHIIKPISDSNYRGREFVEIDFSSFVGLLLNSRAVKNIGLPDKRFFITQDDVEYCIRLNLRNVGKIYLIPKSVITHKESLKKKDLIEKRFLGRRFYRIPYNKLWKTYYGLRNFIYLGRIYSKNQITFISELLSWYIKSIIKIIIFDDFKIKRIWFLTSAVTDGLKGVFDNEKPRRILYGEYRLVR
ncbi:MAG: family 2 glycosyl transferase [Zestosphaera tikiterensis]|uniref:Family 2 glycosyl transferase n=1 Tax=Zestosphaera tikiterensis TaxID=1973259 RepID=A0A2R7Y2A9_9CREN|nr:MAG: family 2 glycosyl transferase [Zestosphaera tikiterensis]